jgi:hypothetical protein
MKIAGLSRDNMRACLMRITAPHYVAGIVWQVDMEDYGKFQTVGQVLKIVKAAPILTWAARRQPSFEWVLSYFNKKGFAVEVFEIPHPEDKTNVERNKIS